MKGEASVEVLASSKRDAEGIAGALAALGIRVRRGAPLRIVIAEDYLSAALAKLNEDALANHKAWLLARPYGRQQWLGPLFVPERTACWECLAYRLRVNGWTAAASIGTRRAATFASLATEAAKWLFTGENAELEGQIRSVDSGACEIQTNAVIRRPQCPACGGRRAAITDVGLMRHISPVTGIISQLERLPDRRGFSVYFAQGSQIFRPDHSGRCFLANRMTAAGGGWIDAEARACCLGEAIERYSTQFHGDEPRVPGSYRELQRHALDPGALMQFSEEQYRKRESWNRRHGSFHRVPEPFDGESRIEWTEVRNLAGDRPRYVPTAYCYLGYGVKYCGADTNGCAAAPAWEEAVLRGFLELVERDAVALWWYNRARRPAADLGSFSSARIALAVEWICLRNRRLHVLDVTTDLGIPAMVAISAKRNASRALIGSAAALDAEMAVWRALTALAKHVAFAESGHRSPSTQGQAFLLPARGARLTAADYRPLASGSLQKDIQTCLRIARRAGLEIYTLDMTRPEVNLPVARVIVPGLRHWWARFAPGRLYDVPAALKWRRRKLKESELNPVPFFL